MCVRGCLADARHGASVFSPCRDCVCCVSVRAAAVRSGRPRRPNPRPTEWDGLTPASARHLRLSVSQASYNTFLSSGLIGVLILVARYFIDSRDQTGCRRGFKDKIGTICYRPLHPLAFHVNHLSSPSFALPFLPSPVSFLMLFVTLFFCLHCCLIIHYQHSCLHNMMLMAQKALGIELKLTSLGISCTKHI